MWDLYPREAAEHYWQDDKEVMTAGKPELNIIEEMKTPQGTMWVQTDKIPYRNSNGEIIGIIGFTLNITERKRAEDTLRESEQRYQELSTIDDLTQLYNSRYFYAQIEREIERSNRYGQPLTLLLLDLDKFKGSTTPTAMLRGTMCYRDSVRW